jgi:hypothetical protein
LFPPWTQALFYVLEIGSSRKFFGEMSAQVPKFTLDRDRGSCTPCLFDKAIQIVQLVGKHQQMQHLFNKIIFSINSSLERSFPINVMH